MKTARLISTIIFLVVFAYAAIATEQSLDSRFLSSDEKSPGRIVKSTVDRVLKIIADDEMGEKQKRQLIYQLAREHINFTEMSRRILAIHWKRVSEQQQTEFISLF